MIFYGIKVSSKYALYKVNILEVKGSQLKFNGYSLAIFEEKCELRRPFGRIQRIAKIY